MSKKGTTFVKNSLERRTLKELEDIWAKQLHKEYQGLATARDLTAFLEDTQFCGNLGFVLARYIQRQYGKIEGESCVVQVHEMRKVFHVCSGAIGTVVSEAEHEDYVEVLSALAQENGLAADFKPSTFRSYLNGKKSNISRESCFKLSFAMGMDWQKTWDFLEAMGEAPYSYRSVAESVYYVCQASTTMNRWSTACDILEAVSNQTLEAEDTALQLGQTQIAEWELTLVSEQLDDLPDYESRKACILNYLKRNAGLMRGYSLSARQVFQKLLSSVMSLSGTETIEAVANAMWSPIWLQKTAMTKRSFKNGRESQKDYTDCVSDFIPFKDLLELPKTLYEKPLWRPRIKQLVDGAIAVEKRDVLFMVLMEWIWGGEVCGGVESMQRFLKLANQYLNTANLNPVSPQEPYDRLILLAVCNDEPLDVLADIFEAATDESAIEQYTEASQKKQHKK